MMNSAYNSDENDEEGTLQKVELQAPEASEVSEENFGSFSEYFKFSLIFSHQCLRYR